MLSHQFESYAERRDVLLESGKFKDMNSFFKALLILMMVSCCRFTFTAFEISEVLTGAGEELMI